MAFTTDVANMIINKILNNTDFTPPASLYVSLHSGDPGDTGANEITAGSNAYARQLVDFNTANAKATTNAGAVTYSNMPAVTVSYVGLWSAQSGGTFWWGSALSASKTVNAGDTFQINASDLDVILT